MIDKVEASVYIIKGKRPKKLDSIALLKAVECISHYNDCALSWISKWKDMPDKVCFIYSMFGEIDYVRIINTNDIKEKVSSWFWGVLERASDDTLDDAKGESFTLRIEVSPSNFFGGLNIRTYIGEEENESLFITLDREWADKH